ncbi:uncharacterized protein RAG0_04593 [Rhynchosporium agropyri]|uniref:Uncharacterized protein n=1 Tax=Rhynchosporium agropyri TaxID=914238 RepID=A0A1E1KD58_9HELO|nr:uncharacterized protein RAG0_04593 [Rhynchosporium agropyri]
MTVSLFSDSSRQISPSVERRGAAQSLSTLSIPAQPSLYPKSRSKTLPKQSKQANPSGNADAVEGVYYRSVGNRMAHRPMSSSSFPSQPSPSNPIAFRSDPCSEILAYHLLNHDAIFLEPIKSGEYSSAARIFHPHRTSPFPTR